MEQSSSVVSIILGSTPCSTSCTKLILLTAWASGLSSFTKKHVSKVQSIQFVTSGSFMSAKWLTRMLWLHVTCFRNNLHLETLLTKRVLRWRNLHILTRCLVLGWSCRSALWSIHVTKKRFLFVFYRVSTLTLEERTPTLPWWTTVALWTEPDRDTSSPFINLLTYAHGGLSKTAYTPGEK